MQVLKELFTQSQGTVMFAVFLSIVLIMLTITIINGYRSARKQKNAAPPTEKEKLRGYLQGMLALWGMAAAVLVMCLIGGIRFTEIGLRPVSFGFGRLFTIITLSVAGLFLIYLLFVMVSSLMRAKFIESQTANSPKSVLDMLPQTRKEKWGFAGLSLAAGVCEEILFRGFLVFLVMAIFPATPLWLVIVIAGAVFGLSHLYQGTQGVFSTGMLGMFFVCLYLVTGSLILPMLLHFLNDLNAAFILNEKEV